MKLGNLEHLVEAPARVGLHRGRHTGRGKADQSESKPRTVYSFVRALRELHMVSA